MHDGIELEINGVCSAVIITEPFRIPAKAIAEIRGIPSYPFAVVEHPIGSLTESGLEERAHAALPQILKILRL